MTATKTVFDIMPDLDFDACHLSKYYSTTFRDDNFGDGDED